MKKELPGSLSRRRLVKHSMAAAAFWSAPAPLRAMANEDAAQRKLAYVGTYTGGGEYSNGNGIYLFELDPATGDLKLVELAYKSVNPSWLSLHPSGRFLYAANEVNNFEGKHGSISAFAVNRASGKLELLNVVSSAGAGPAHMSVDASGKFLFVANYGSGDIAVLPVQPNGSLDAAVFVSQDTGSVGAAHAATAPAGSFAISGHDAPHAHMIHPDPRNRFVLHADLGQDRLYVWKFDAATGKLSPAAIPFVTVPPGDGPRHFVFHSKRPWMYSLQEEASTVVFWHYDPETGSLQPQQTISTLPSGFKGTNFSAEIVFSRDQRFLYLSNRLANTIAILSIGSEGQLTYLGETSTMGDYPRHLEFDPGGSFLYSCNHRSDTISAFRVDKQSGLATFTGKYIAVGSPACILFLT